MTRIENVSEIHRYTNVLYRELCGERQPVGSSILLKYHERYLLVSAFHVIDMEHERIEKENDTAENNIPQDDMKSIFVKCGSKFFCVNDIVKALVCIAKYDEATKQPIFSDDAEWCVCELSEDLVRELIEAGNLFFNIDRINQIVVPADSEIIISGYPGYVPKRDKEELRSFKSTFIENAQNEDRGILRVHLDRTKAYCFEHDKEVNIPKVQGIRGMSGGGMWYKNIDHYIPIGIILQQDSDNNFVEGYNLIEILKTYMKI